MLLPEIEPLVERLLDRRAQVIAVRNSSKELLTSTASDFGGPIPSQLAANFIAIERLIKKIRSHGCLIKDANSGLVDFLSVRDGREVYLCWKYGEPRIEYFHELHTGFAGRQPI